MYVLHSLHFIWNSKVMIMQIQIVEDSREGGISSPMQKMACFIQKKKKRSLMERFQVRDKKSFQFQKFFEPPLPKLFWIRHWTHTMENKFYERRIKLFCCVQHLSSPHAIMHAWYLCESCYERYSHILRTNIILTSFRCKLDLFFKIIRVTNFERIKKKLWVDVSKK